MHDQRRKLFRMMGVFAPGVGLLSLLLIWPLAWLSVWPGVSVAQSAAAQGQDNEDRPGRRPRRLGDSLAVDPTTEWVPGQDSTDRSAELARKISLGYQALADGALLQPANANALEFFDEALAIDPGNSEAVEGLDQVARALEARAADVLAVGNPRQIRNLLAALQAVGPRLAGVAQLQARLGQALVVAADLDRAERFLRADQLLAPAGENAAQTYQQILARNPGQSAARAGLANVRARQIEAVRALVASDKLAMALTGVDAALLIWPTDTTLLDLRDSIDQARQQRWSEQLAQLVQAIETEQLVDAQALLGALMAGGYAGDTAPLLAQIAAVRKRLSYKPGDRLQDNTPNGPAPRMVVVPRGTFSMGSPARERDRFDREGPQKTVTFALPFALAETEVTVAEYGRFVSATGYLTLIERGGESTTYQVSSGVVGRAPAASWRLDYRGEPATGDLPVIHVSHRDAQAYADWLSQATGSRYRLPSEAEFEYALRAGSQTRFWWGNASPSREVENLTGARDEIRDWRWPDAFRGYDDGFWGPAPAGSFVANPFGFFDLGGNVLEWVADCYQGSLASVPVDGRAVVAGNCELYSVRGGAWASSPAHSRSASRSGVAADRASCLLGFRVARDL